MKNTAMQARLDTEILDFVASRKTLQLASIDENGLPFSSYAPFAIGDDCIYVLLSEIAVHGINLMVNPRASALVIEDEDTADILFARKRVNYQMRVENIEYQADGWDLGIETLVHRHGEISANLSQKEDFKLFRLIPERGRYVKGFGKAYSFSGDSLTGDVLDHMRDGHVDRKTSAA
ncbi:putative protein [BD1-7 clade bacterium]|uniref:Pyridoxamine 5'-phosphate oxidase N-terminal domain-containing protein n=1 Tax=BD1-7 clade bacterium TaxID=2029982 RepID=A0A5S9N151_9GAMM|nr:putative protein [BD1-7 clade bacterium]CAA0082907.1 putative protein [BD1-7 clade bacterium]